MTCITRFGVGDIVFFSVETSTRKILQRYDTKPMEMHSSVSNISSNNWMFCQPHWKSQTRRLSQRQYASILGGSKQTSLKSSRLNTSSHSISPILHRMSKNTVAPEIPQRKGSTGSSLDSPDDLECKRTSEKSSRKLSKFFEGRSSSFVTRITQKMNQLVEPINLKRGRSTVRSRRDRSSSMVAIPDSVSTIPSSSSPRQQCVRMPWLHDDAMTASTSDLLDHHPYKNHRNVSLYRSWDVLSCDSGFATQTRTDEVISRQDASRCEYNETSGRSQRNSHSRSEHNH